MGDIEKVMSRVRKLLQLARSTNEAEAALAAQRAAELMAEHNLSEAAVRVQGGDVQPAEAIVERHVVEHSRKRVAWKGSVASAVAKSFGCRMYWTSGAICYFGRVSAVQAASYTAQYLWGEVDRLADAAWDASEERLCDASPRLWKGSFRLGAASAIAGRLTERTREERLARRNERGAAQEAAQAVPDAVPVNPRALALVARDSQEVEAEYEAFGKRSHMRTATRIGRVSSGGGYDAGHDAGRRVHLGSGRAGLGAGAARLRGR